MSAIPLVLAAGALADAWLAAYAVLRVRRTLAKVAYVALLLDFIVAAGAFAGVQVGALDASWTPVALWAFVLSHPLAGGADKGDVVLAAELSHRPPSEFGGGEARAPELRGLFARGLRRVVQRDDCLCR